MLGVNVDYEIDSMMTMISLRSQFQLKQYYLKLVGTGLVMEQLKINFLFKLIL